MKNLTKGFTLIELLVVITIIGILATGAVTVFTSQIQKARDTTRINDVKALQTAVEQTYQDSAEYPNEAAGAFTGAVDPYIELIPEDPKHGDNCNDSGGTGTICTYAYATADDAGISNGKYEISTWFEAQGSVSSKAAGSVDNGGDDDRFELGIDVNGVATVIAPHTGTTPAYVTGCATTGTAPNQVLSLSKSCN